VYRLVLAGTIITICGLTLWAADKPPKDTFAAAATRKKLETAISVEFDETRLEDVAKEIAEKVKDATGRELSFKLDNVGGISNNYKLTYNAEKKPVTVILDELFKPHDMGYIVISDKYKTYNNRYDGWVLIVKGKERGYPEGVNPTAAEDPKDKADPGKDKPVVKEDPNKDKPPVENPDKDEMMAATRLKLARLLANGGKPEKAIVYCEEILKNYPKTKAAAEAKELLEKLKK
jgi:hypothetical protein